MIFFPIDNVFIEGPDCSGKTSLINSIHSQTQYKWHLMDRSQFSRSIFAKMYGRNISGLAESERSEFYNLNNFTVILIPPRDEIIKRFKERGDEIHNMKSLMQVYDLFLSSVSSVISFPHFYSPSLFKKETSDEIGKDLCNVLDKREKMSISGISGVISSFAMASPRNEASGISLTFYENLGFEDVKSSVMSTKSESKYYKKILNGIIKKIKQEIKGNNEYNLPQGLSSRRFIYTDDSCISLIHATCRNSVLDLHVVFRSTDVQEKLSHDLNFIYYLSKEVYNVLKDLGRIESVRYRLFFNSAHILKVFNPVC